VTSNLPDLAPLTEAAARVAAVDAVVASGIDPGAVKLVRLGTRAVFRLAETRILARVTTSTHRDVGEHEIAVARWLGKAGVPVDQPWSASGVYESSGFVVTLWRARDGDWGTTRELAVVLRLLHAVPPTSAPPLSSWDPFPEMRRRLSRAEALGESDRAQLHALVDAAEHDVRRLHFELDAGVIHGDASVGNLLRSDDGELVLFDLESVSLGPREWDLVITAVYRELGWHTDAEYDDFADTYGFDIRSWAGYPVLAAAQRLRMVCWLAGKAHAGDLHAVEELCHRVDDVLGRTTDYAWQPL
jgi:aminoglycoside phosphotransferase (APT) family kinase protein